MVAGPTTNPLTGVAAGSFVIFNGTHVGPIPSFHTLRQIGGRDGCRAHVSSPQALSACTQNNGFWIDKGWENRVLQNPPNPVPIT